jgi:hypothetical protein
VKIAAKKCYWGTEWERDAIGGAPEEVDLHLLKAARPLRRTLPDFIHRGLRNVEQHGPLPHRVAVRHHVRGARDLRVAKGGGAASMA